MSGRGTAYLWNGPPYSTHVKFTATPVVWIKLGPWRYPAAEDAQP